MQYQTNSSYGGTNQLAVSQDPVGVFFGLGSDSACIYDVRIFLPGVSPSSTPSYSYTDVCPGQTLTTGDVSVVSLDDPTSDSGDTTVTGTATSVNNNLSSVAYQGDSVSVGADWSGCTAVDGSFNSKSETFSCTVSALGEGSHTFYVRAEDSIGTTSVVTTNSSDASVKSFIVDTVSPDLSLTPLSPDPNSDNTPSLSGTATELVVGTVSSVEYQMDGTGGSWTACTADDGAFDEASEAFSCTVGRPLTDGSHTIYVRATDSSGNTTTSGDESSDTFTVDTLISISVTKIDGYVVTPIRWLINRRPVFEGFTDPGAIVTVHVPSAGISDVTTATSEGNWVWQSSTNLPLGIHEVYFNAEDSAGNTASTKVTLVVLLSFGGEDDGDDPNGDKNEEDEEKDDGDDEWVIPETGGANGGEVGDGEDEDDSFGTIDFFITTYEAIRNLVRSTTERIRGINISGASKVSAATTISVITLAGGTEVAASTGVTFVQLPLVLWYSLVGVLKGLFKRRRPWGVVYDSVTKEPLSRAVVRVFQEKNLVETVVTDINGVFTVNLEPGSYNIQVQKGGYMYPTELIEGDSDGGRTPIYRGGSVEIKGEESSISMYIPVDSESAKTGGKILTQARSQLSLFLGWGILAFVLFATIFSFWSYLAVGSFIYLILGMLNLFILGINLFVRGGTSGRWGTAVDEDGIPVSSVDIGLFDYAYDRLIDNRITDDNGKFRFIVPGGRYWLRPKGTDYILVSYSGKGGVDVGKETDKEIVVNKDIMVRKTEGTPN